MMRKLLLLLLICALIGGAAQAQDGHGVVRLSIYPYPIFEQGASVWPGCSDSACLLGVRLILPSLFSIDPQTGTVRNAVAGERVLIAEPPTLPEREQQYTIRDDMQWSDGTPLTAYDAALSLLAREVQAPDQVQTIESLRIDDPQTFTVVYRTPDCAAQSRLNSLIFASEIYTRGFKDFADDFLRAREDVPSLADWLDAYQERYSVVGWSPIESNTSQDLDSLIWGGAFVPSMSLGFNTLRAVDTDLHVVQAVSSTAGIDFSSGDANLLIDLPFADRADLRRLGDIQLYEAPGYAVDRLVFNLSDPLYPRDAFVDGEPLEQVPNPILSDVRVRRAIRYAIDVQALIDVGLFGSGVALNGAYSPASWAYDPTLPDWEYNPPKAERLLYEAGWRGDGVRRCLGCEYPERRSRLSLRLMVDGDPVRNPIADVLANQLRAVGIEVEFSFGDGSGQDYDLLLTGTSGASLWSREPDLRYQLVSETDVLSVNGGNVSSVNDPALSALLDRARSTPTCSISERAEAYRDVQRHLNETLLATWLYVRNDFYAARGIVNFAPLPGEPLWNILDWVVTR